ncbi:MAG: glycoside hydrolase family 9 protein [Chitinophagaceae bacterium]|nr:glycoside hydrolase family 9 protein [Chitinophagaceae bacterium]
MKNIIIIFLLFISANVKAQFSEFIHIDQFGYLIGAEKVAVISNPEIGYNASQSYNPSSTFYVKNVATNQIVFSGPIQLWDSGKIHDYSGDRGWWFDFSTLNTPGNYVVFDSFQNKKSAQFEIGENVYYNVFKDAGRMFFYNRCNSSKSSPYAETKWTDGLNFMNPKQDGNCFPIYDSLNNSLMRNLSGGWFDAGDFNKYVSYTYSTLHNLLHAYQENPSAFGDDWNIPESGNGIPDIIDEIKWETDWLLKMVTANGHCPIKVGSKNYSENTNVPPSQNYYPRYYGPECTSASISAASVLAHAGIVMKNFPSLLNYVDSLTIKSKAALDYVRPKFFDKTLEFNCDDYSIVSGNADVDSVEQVNRLMTASIYLYELNGDMGAKNFVDFNYYILESYINNYWGAYNLPLVDAFLLYLKNANANPTVVVDYKDNFSTAVQNNWNYYFGWNTLDLYRAFMPEWSYHWGSNQIVANYSNLNNAFAAQKIGLDSVNQKRKAAESLHYFHGLNPNSLVYLSNTYSSGAEKCVNEIYHNWFADGTSYDNAITSTNGPAPGFLVGGPNQYYSQSAMSPPYNQPFQKAYLDFNDNWPNNSWEVSEPAIYYQAAYLRLLSKYVKPYVAPANTFEVDNLKVTIYPNPCEDVLYMQDLNITVKYFISNQLGQVLLKGKIENFENKINIQSLKEGFYYLQLIDESGKKFNLKFIKKSI